MIFDGVGERLTRIETKIYDRKHRRTKHGRHAHPSPTPYAVTMLHSLLMAQAAQQTSPRRCGWMPRGGRGPIGRRSRRRCGDWHVRRRLQESALARLPQDLIEGAAAQRDRGASGGRVPDEDWRSIRWWQRRIRWWQRRIRWWRLVRLAREKAARLCLSNGGGV